MSGSGLGMGVCCEGKPVLQAHREKGTENFNSFHKRKGISEWKLAVWIGLAVSGSPCLGLPILKD